jgi:MFS family permease
MTNAVKDSVVASKTGSTGMFAFTLVCVGQVFSLLGTAMTGFALTIWAWEVTGQATALALVGFFGFAPVVLVSPLAGALVDRWNRKLTMMFSDIAAGLSTVAVLALYLSGGLQVWHLYVTNMFAAAFQAFHFPAYSAAVSTMVSKEHYGRASGMLSLAQNAAGVFAPIFGAFFLGVVGIEGVMVIDLVSVSIAVCILLFVRVPRPVVTEAGQKGRGSIWKESIYGFRYIGERSSLLGLLLVFFSFNLIATFGFTLLAPMILARTGNDVVVFGSVMSILGAGGVIGSLLLSAWGGPKRRIQGVLFGLMIAGVLTSVLGLGSSVWVWAPTAFLLTFLTPIINGSSQAIWQAKVAPDVQGRVFSARLLIAQISAPASMLIAGPLADRVFEPAMVSNGALSTVFGPFVGNSAGSGMALMFVFSGVLSGLVGVAGYSVRVVRDAEDILPDHDAAVQVSEGSG